METNIDRLREAVRKANLLPEDRAPSFMQGTVTNVSDPDNLGRAKVELRGFEQYETDWLQPFEYQFEGQLPAAYLKKTVTVIALYNDYESLRYQIGGPLIYRQGPLPPATEANAGLRIIRITGSESYDLVCLLRNGRWVWEPSCALSHVHDPGDTLFQSLDSGGDFQQPIPAELGSDRVYFTTVKPYIKNTKSLPPVSNI